MRVVYIEPLQETIELSMYLEFSEILYYIKESQKDRDLEQHRETPLEWTTTVLFEEFHRLFAHFFRIVFVLLLDLLHFWLKVCHLLLHVCACLCTLVE